MSKSGPEGKSFQIPKQLVWEAYRRVKAKKGAAGVDGQSIADFEEDLRNNLYRIWNRMSSGTYFPPPVKAVEIPKPHGGGTRILGVPTVADRIAQTVVALRLETRTESIFHHDSYGYRPRKSAHDALRKCRERCWRKDWVLDLDIRKFFDSLDHDLVVKTVEANTADKWVLLYVKRWLKAPLQLPDGTLQERDKGTPQGSAVSPVLANLFLHYAFGMFLEREFPTVEFERYADDAVVHCVTERQARQVREALTARLAELGLELHPGKTKIVYCKDSLRHGEHETVTFTFLGYAFRPRQVMGKNGKIFTSFTPAISPEALQLLPQAKQLRKARAVLDTFLPIAGQLNMPTLQSQLQAHAVAALIRNQPLRPFRRRVIVALDIEGSTSRPDPVKAELRTMIYELFDAALRSAGISAQRRDRFADRGDGLLALIDPADQALLLSLALPAFSRLLAGYNASLPEPDGRDRRLRVRVAVHSGNVHDDENGCFGEALDIAFRLLDAPSVEETLKMAHGAVLLAVSSDIHDLLLSYSGGNAGYTASYLVTVQVAGNDHQGWIHVLAEAT